MKYEIAGTIMQTLSIDLNPGEKIYSQTSTMAWMNEQIEMNTNTGGGLFSGLKRSLTGGSFFITDFQAKGNGQIAFAPRFPGKILAKKLAANESLICRKETFLCAEKTVSLELAFQKNFGSGLFGGQGFILQKVSGPGTVWLDLSGEVTEKHLAAGEKLLVHAGHIGVQTTSIQFDIQMVSGFKNILFGGQGLFLATLTGPGHVLLQSMPIIHLAEEIAQYMPVHNSQTVNHGGTGADAGSIIGGILGGIVDGDN